MWAQMLAERGDRARAAGHHALADFIALKASNDEIRQRAVAWLLGSLVELAAHANRRNIPIEIDREEPHSFADSGANMVGVKASFRHGIRCLSVEAGWTRTPGDGFMRGGALAVAHLRHFGLKRHSVDLALRKDGDLPQWFAVGTDGHAAAISDADLRRHISILIDHPNGDF
jgi:hypothetical protein